MFAEDAEPLLDEALINETEDGNSIQSLFKSEMEEPSIAL
jgi:hypothetical protein